MEMPETSVIQLSDNVYAIDQVMVRSFLIVGGSSALLLDTGAGDIDLPALVAGITNKPVTLCMTHSDGDHTAALHRFSSACIHPAEIDLLLSKNPGLTPVLIPVDEGHVFDLGGLRLEVVFNPGHTPGSISLLDRDNKVLYSGDTVSYGPVFMFGDHRNKAAFSASMKKLQALADTGAFTTVYPCHNTCPVGVETIAELQACIDGIISGSLEGKAPVGMLPPGAHPKQYTVGKSGIYCDD